MHTTSSCRSSIQRLCKYLIHTVIDLLGLISITSNGDKDADTRTLMKGSALAVLDLDGLDYTSIYVTFLVHLWYNSEGNLSQISGYKLFSLSRSTTSRRE
jgi:hypothetical protein